jgi:hypothetical protein
MPWGGATVSSALDEGVEPGDEGAHILVQGALAVEARLWQMACSL